MTTIGADDIVFQFHFNFPEEIVVENFTIKYWESLNIIHIKPLDSNLSEQMIQEGLAGAFGDMDPMPVIVVGDEFDIDIYRLHPAQLPAQLELEI